jgi:hypothetical protein
MAWSVARGWPGRNASAKKKSRRGMVFGAMIRIVSMTGVEAGADPSNTTLEEEGFGEVSADRLIESFSRHFIMVGVDAWQVGGFAVVMLEYGQRLPRERRLRGDIVESGDLLPRSAGVGTEHKSLVQALASPSWLDSKTKLLYA